jgi:hypothetical protein
MATSKKSSPNLAGGILAFLGSLVYLYVVFTWYASGAAFGPWIGAAQFFGPFVVAFAMVSAITLFFLSIGIMVGRMNGDMASKVLWKFVMIAGVTEIIVTGGSALFWAAIVGFVLTYVGAMTLSM